MVGVGVLLIGGLAVADRATRPHAATTTPTTVAPSTTSTVGTTTTTLASTTTAAEAPPRLVALPDQTLPRAPGLYLEVLLSDGSIAEIDMATGATHSFAVADVRGDYGAIAVLDGGLVVNLADQFYALPVGTSEVRRIDGVRGQVISAGNRYALAFVEQGPNRPEQGLVLFDGTGAMAFTDEIANDVARGQGNLSLNSGDQFVVNSGERIGLLNLITGQAVDVGEGQLLASGPNHVLRRTCDKDGACRNEVLPLAGDAVPRELPFAFSGFGRMVLSPDGQWLSASRLDTSGQIAAEVVNVQTGTRLTVSGPENPWDGVEAFSSDGHFMATWMDGAIALWDLSSGTEVARAENLGSDVVSASFATRPSGV